MSDRMTSLRQALRENIRADETRLAEQLIEAAKLPAATSDKIAMRARGLVEAVRRNRVGQGGIDAFMHAYELSSKEGIVLMCLAEALLRIPDAETANKLIKDKLRDADFAKHLGESDSMFVNASTWALMLTGRILKMDEDKQDWMSTLKKLVARSGEGVIRQAITQAMKILGNQFVMGRTIEEALDRAKASEARGYSYSYDMLGEAARTARDATRYLQSYKNAIGAIGESAKGKEWHRGPNISVKLSALHPRYEMAQADRVMVELLPRVIELAQLAAHYDIGLTIDAEEADRLDLSLDIIEGVCSHASLKDWQGLGMAIQAYQKRCFYLVDWLADMAKRHHRRLMVRLVKGAYWDSEIKWAQERGMSNYPVFTRKITTDVSYLVCAKKLLAQPDVFYPMFATHNAQTLASIIEMAGGVEEAQRKLEFQRLHGMGEALYEEIVPSDKFGIPCRIYAPVGSHEDLLAYLVRRLLENGANTSFVNRIQDEKAPLEEIIADPIAKLEKIKNKPHSNIPLPSELFGKERRNSSGLDLNDPLTLEALLPVLKKARNEQARIFPFIGGKPAKGKERAIHNPADRRQIIGYVEEAGVELVEEAISRALRAFPDWSKRKDRADCLMRAANLLEQNRDRILSLCIYEAGKTIPDAIAELREAVDFCRYYAARAREDFIEPRPLPGPTGERNQLMLTGRGVFVCISPWNFPLAIFMGQVAAALAAGNAVIAKPAEQTPLIAGLAVQLLHEAGVPGDVLHFLPGEGGLIGAALIKDPRIAGVAFTGSTETARLINRELAKKNGPIIPFIAETGGQNAMIVDSSALPEQVVRDVLTSSFQSAGQRCSALRILFVQEDISDKLLEMLSGAMDELHIGDPGLLSSDIGPVIDGDALKMLQEHEARMRSEARILKKLSLSENCRNGTFFAPTLIEIDHLKRLTGEVFGPILHIVRYKAGKLEDVLNSIKETGFGLTLGIHSRIDQTVQHIVSSLPVGNCYVNRNMIGAVVGVQPFGGMGLSGTGPKAGGPFYLHRFASEKTITVDTTAAGGNASLLSIEEQPL